MKKCVWIFIFLVLTTQYSFCLIFDLIEKGMELAAKGINKVNEEVFQKTMIAHTIESVNMLRKNYEESVNFYNKIKQIQENPYGVLQDEEVRRLISRYKEGEKLLNDIDKIMSTYTETKQKIDTVVQQYENTKKSILENIATTKRSIEKDINYLKSNWDLINNIVKNINVQTSDVVKKLENIEEIKKLPTNEEKKAKVEEMKTSLALMQLQAQQQTNILLVKLLEIQLQQIEKQVLKTKQSFDKQYQFFTSMKSLLTDRNISTRR